MSRVHTRRASGFENYTVFLKNSISFPRFGDQYTRKNMRHKGYCMYKHGDDDARCVWHWDHSYRISAKFLNFLTRSPCYCHVSATSRHFLWSFFLVLVPLTSADVICERPNNMGQSQSHNKHRCARCTADHTCQERCYCSAEFLIFIVEAWLQVQNAASRPNDGIAA